MNWKKKYLETFLPGDKVKVINIDHQIDGPYYIGQIVTLSKRYIKNSVWVKSGNPAPLDEPSTDLWYTVEYPDNGIGNKEIVRVTKR